MIDTLHALLDVTGTDTVLLEALHQSTSVAGQLAFCKLAASRYPKATEALQRDVEKYGRRRHPDFTPRGALNCRGLRWRRETRYRWLEASLTADDGAVRQTAVVSISVRMGLRCAALQAATQT